MGAMVLSCDDKVQNYSFEPPTALNCFGRIFVNRGMYEKVCVRFLSRCLFVIQNNRDMECGRTID